MANHPMSRQEGLRPFRLAVAAVLGCLAVSPPPAHAQERIMFPAIESAQNEIVKLIKNETVRLDIAVWLLNDNEITQAIIARHQAQVPVRVLGDRASIFESDANTRASFIALANAGVPIRLRYNPTWFPEIMHWKTGIFVGQGVVEFGSANWTNLELEPWTADGIYKDETAFFTNQVESPGIFRAFLTRFDRFWADTTYFVDWPAAYQAETGQAWTKPMTIDRTRIEPDYPDNPPGMNWGQGTELNSPMIAEINGESQRIDMVSYRLTVPDVTAALINRHNAGVPVRVIIEPTQYRNPGFPEYWLVGAMTDRLWAAGVRVKQRKHPGLTHMKALITSDTALLASSNFTKFWQRDHNYFISSSAKPSLYDAMGDRFDAMWNDSAGFEDFTPQPPWAAALVAPASGVAGASTTPRLEWKRAAWATSFDVYIGTTTTNLTFAGRVNAVVNENPPATYAFTPTQPLQPGTRYIWRVYSRTDATDKNPALTAASEIWAFTTSGDPGSGGGGTSGPYTGSPAPLPGTIQAENFDLGASGVAYADTTAGNSGGAYRTTDVDIEATSDSGGGYNLGWTRPGEWLKYTVNVTAAGTYTLEFRVAARAEGATFHLEVNGVNKTGPLTIPNTGSYQTWQTVSKSQVSLAAGQQVWRLVIDSLGPSGVGGNINYIRAVASSSGGGGGPTNTPYGGTPVSLPGVIQSENFDEGGKGLAYHDTTAGNAGGQYRSTDVDIEATSDPGGGHNIGWSAVGEWWKYTVNVTAAGTYTLEFRVAARAPGATFHLEVNGVDRTGPLVIPNTGSYQTWATVTKTGVSLAAGPQVWRIVIDKAGTVVGNFNYVRVTAGSSGGGSTPSPITVQAENFDDGGEGVAYHDLTSANEGGAYRSTAVDIEAFSGGYSVGYALATEWLRYTVNVPTAATYTLDLRVASNGPGGTFHVEVNGVDRTGPLTIPNTGGWWTWTTLQKANISVGSGQQVIRLVMDTNGATTFVGNFDWFRFTPQ